MAFPEHINSENEPTASNTMQKKPRVLLAASGSVAAIKFESLCHSFSEWAEVKAVTTKSALHFIDKASLPMDVVVHSDEEEWSSWQKIGDSVLHIELRKWADVMVIAPLSANTLGKIAGGLCDNLLTCIVRAWDYKKPVFVAPAMNTYMWSNPFTQKHLDVITELGISLVPPITKRLACGDYGNGAMAEPSLINSTVTGNLEEIAWLKMEGLGIKKHFTVPNFGGYGSDQVDRGQLMKIAADSAETLFPGGFDQRVHVGDTPNDIKAAEFGGALAIGVCTGIFSKQGLEQARNGGAVILANLCDSGSFMNLLGIQS